MSDKKKAEPQNLDLNSLENPMELQINWYYEGTKDRGMLKLLPLPYNNWYTSLLLGEGYKEGTGLIQPLLDRTLHEMPWPSSVLQEGLASLQKEYIRYNRKGIC